MDEHGPLDRAIRNIKIATFLAAVAVCVVVADIIIVLIRR